jgi:predicted RNase H-like nuclease (RuvC/YqgF family)
MPNDMSYLDPSSEEWKQEFDRRYRSFVEAKIARVVTGEMNRLIADNVILQSSKERLETENVSLRGELDAQLDQIKRLKAELAKWESDYETWKGEGAFG